jgi:hypothetical protein
MATPWDKSKKDLEYEENRRRETISDFNSRYNTLERGFNVSFSQDRLMAELTNGYKN